MSVSHQELVRAIDTYRPQLKAHCHRVLGSSHDAEDAVQETCLRAWRAADGFEGRSSLRSWLYRIAHNVCIDQATARKRRPTPTDEYEDVIGNTEQPDPAERALAREDLRLALAAAVQHLPARQRAVLVLRDILCWRAAEVAELLDTSIAAVNSALQRAHAALDSGDLGPLDQSAAETRHPLVAQYLGAFEADDVDALAALSNG